MDDWLYVHWYFLSMGVTNKTFQLARSIFSFHIEMFFLLGKSKMETWKLKCFEPIERSNQNLQGMEHCFLSQNRIYFILKTKKASQISFIYLKTNLASPFSFQLNQISFHNDEKSLLWLEKDFFLFGTNTNMISTTAYVLDEINWIFAIGKFCRVMFDPSQLKFWHVFTFYLSTYT